MRGPNVHWGAARVAIHRALELNGIDSEILAMGNVAEFMSSRDRLESARGSGDAPATPVDEAGMLYVDSAQADIVVTFREQVDWAYRGLEHNAIYPLKNLRALARLVQPQYVGVAATRESGITSLEQVAAERRPIRLFSVTRGKHDTRTMGVVTSRVLEESGFTQADVEAWGGRGLDESVPTFVMADHTVSTHASLSDEAAYLIVKALDDHPECLQQVHANFAFNPRTAWQQVGLPLHPGAEAYYREHGYLSSAASGIQN